MSDVYLNSIGNLNSDKFCTYKVEYVNVHFIINYARDSLNKNDLQTGKRFVIHLFIFNYTQNNLN